MRYTAPMGLIHYFHSHHVIELDNLLSEQELSLLTPAIDKSLALRLGMIQENLVNLTPFDLYQAGHDLSRTDETIKKIIWSKKLAEIIHEFTGQKPIRFAYDQVFRAGNNLNSPPPPFFSAATNLEQMTALQGQLYGLMLTLQEGEGVSAPFSPKKGSGMLFTSHYPINFETLYKCTKQNYLLIVFTGAISVVLHKEQLPHPYAFKQLGYGIGDTLSDDLHPILLR